MRPGGGHVDQHRLAEDSSTLRGCFRTQRIENEAMAAPNFMLVCLLGSCWHHASSPDPHHFFPKLGLLCQIPKDRGVACFVTKSGTTVRHHGALVGWQHLLAG